MYIIGHEGVANKEIVVLEIYKLNRLCRPLWHMTIFLDRINAARSFKLLHASQTNEVL